MMGQGWARRLVRSVVAAALLALPWSSAAGQQLSQVRAVLFYSPTCPHCHVVLTEKLPPLVQEYGPRLQIVTISTATPTGQQLYEEVVRHFAIPDERLGVPTLIVGSTVLVGSGEIPAEFPEIVRQGVASVGIDWPAVPALRRLLEQQGLLSAPAVGPERVEPERVEPERAEPERVDTAPAHADVAPRPAPAADLDSRAGVARAGDSLKAPPPPGLAGMPASADARAAAPAVPTDTSAAAAPSPGAAPLAGALELVPAGAARMGMRDRFLVDPVANGVAVAVLLIMLLALAAVAAAVAGRAAWRAAPEWLTPTLALVGMGVAAYLTFVEMTGTAAVCGPVGDCNTVQQSAYARVAGLIPLGLVGVLGYLALLGTWIVGVAGSVSHRAAAQVVLWATALLGTLYSVYLTFLEPFVIGATCAWCVTSALVMTLLLLVRTPPALAVRGSRSGHAG